MALGLVSAPFALAPSAFFLGGSASATAPAPAPCNAHSEAATALWVRSGPAGWVLA